MVNGTNGLLPRYPQILVTCWTFNLPIKLVETVQKGRVFKVQTDKYELISKTPPCGESKTAGAASKKHLPETDSVLKKPAVVTAKPTVLHQLKNEPVKPPVYIAQQLFSEEASLPIQEAKKLNCFDDSWSWSF